MQRGKELGIHSRITHAGANPDQELGSVSPPIYQSSTFQFATAQEGARRFAGEETGFIYTRLGNPTVAALESAVADLEGGAGALATASGMAAVNCIYLALLEAGSHLVGTDALYGSSRRIIETEYSRFGVTYDFVDTSRPEKVAEAVQDHTRLVFLESPANPTLKLTDIAACADIAHRSGALVVVDNTFMSPVLQNPLALGADIVIHSLTKYINGHTDVVGGIIVFKTRELLERVRPVFIQSGGCMDPHQAWLILRGLRTLGLRVEKAQANARKVAEFLSADPRVEQVYYPGLPDFSQYDLAQKQMRGPGSMLSFELTGGLDAGIHLMNSVRLATLAVSLGGFETLIQHPASMTHASMPREERIAAGISDGLVRLAVGCENAEDLIRDLDTALI